MVGVVEGLPDPALVAFSGTDEGLEDRLMAPPAVELTPSSAEVDSFGGRTTASLSDACRIMRVN